MLMTAVLLLSLHSAYAQEEELTEEPQIVETNEEIIPEHPLDSSEDRAPASEEPVEHQVEE